VREEQKDNEITGGAQEHRLREPEVDGHDHREGRSEDRADPIDAPHPWDLALQSPPMQGSEGERERDAHQETEWNRDDHGGAHAKDETGPQELREDQRKQKGIAQKRNRNQEGGRGHLRVDSLLRRSAAP
jgi:hypothetical protein